MTNSRKRHTPEQVVRKLGQADRMLADGQDVAAVCRELGVSEQTYYRWRNQYGGLKADDAKRLKELEKQNATLKRLLACQGPLSSAHRRPVFLPAGGHQNCPLVASWFARLGGGAGHRDG
ncbi:transposase, partial [Micrococcus luteus]|uniref:transposase n=1 Tax=Micrococcus luteus TaxID=1270 RepID=UPI003CECA3EC